jgi:starch phosphorylase
MQRENSDRSYLTVFDLAMDKDSIKQSFANHVEYTQGKDQYSSSPLDYYSAVALSARDRLLDRWNKTQQRYYNEDCKRVYYLSLEFMIGRLLEDSLINLGIHEETRAALAELDISLGDLAELEWDAGLGNGGLGRLAACFLDSMATLGLPAMGYGIRYEYGIFKQLIVNGTQVEYPDSWLRYGNPWELPRSDTIFPVSFYGRVESASGGNGSGPRRWVDTEDVMAMAYDILVPGYRNDVVNTLRLWSAKATREFNFSYFNQGDYIHAVQEKNATENISRVLYPNDSFEIGRELRLKQEYFFVSATLQDALHRHLKTHLDPLTLPDKAIFQLNDTHPAIAVAELMRLLMDRHGLTWEPAWRATTRSFAYTNHTILSEALERWPVSLMERVLPRHLQIIYEINQRFLDSVDKAHPGDPERLRRVSVIEEGPEKQVRMANLAVVGSSHVNGVSALHSRILCERLFADFAALRPQAFSNKTNGITPRRWLLKCNPKLAALISDHIGDGWVRDLDQLGLLVPLAANADFQARWQAVKRANKQTLSDHVAAGCGVDCHPEIVLAPDALFDVQIKRLHEYKRQLLNVLHIIALYRRYRERAPADSPHLTFLFAGKAAPGYFMAKLIIRLINAVGLAVNGDPSVNRFLQVLFLPNYSVSLAERIIPAADVSEQISTAGTEASGTGNMKLALSGALTLGTLDGANVEILEAVGEENIYIFGHTYNDVKALWERGYHPRAIYENDPELKGVLDAIAAGEFSPDEPELFRPIVSSLLDGGDPYLVLADFASYRECRHRVFADYGDRAAWTRRSILNVANMGRFSSDRTIADYAKEIWNVQPCLNGNDNGGGD